MAKQAIVDGQSEPYPTASDVLVDSTLTLFADPEMLFSRVEDVVEMHAETTCHSESVAGQYLHERSARTFDQ